MAGCFQNGKENWELYVNYGGVSKSHRHVKHNTWREYLYDANISKIKTQYTDIRPLLKQCSY